jgi:flagellar motor switch protein FliN/FliY
MGSELGSVLRLEVPVIVRLGERSLPLVEILSLMPGSIVDLDRRADEELGLYVNNRKIGTGTAVKVGENFGVRITGIGTPALRAAALAAGDAQRPTATEPTRAGGGATSSA